MIPSWTTRGGVSFEYCPQRPFGLWGILNLTPDSFFDGGLHLTPASALEHARLLREQGCAVLDVGAASSRPGAADLPAAEEKARLAPVLEGLTPFRDGSALVSVDTWRAECALYALEQGAHIINDISACRWEPELLDIVAQHQPGYVLMHCQGRPGFMQDAPRYADVVDEALEFFTARMSALTAAGLPESRIVLDPGLGFGKSLEHNLALLRALPRLQALGRPLLIGLSHKSMFQALAAREGLECGGEDPSRPLGREALGQATLCATALLGPGLFHRVHDVAGARLALTVARALAGGEAAASRRFNDVEP